MSSTIPKKRGRPPKNEQYKQHLDKITLSLMGETVEVPVNKEYKPHPGRPKKENVTSTFTGGTGVIGKVTPNTYAEFQNTEKFNIDYSEKRKKRLEKYEQQQELVEKKKRGRPKKEFIETQAFRDIAKTAACRFYPEDDWDGVKKLNPEYEYPEEVVDVRKIREEEKQLQKDTLGFGINNASNRASGNNPFSLGLDKVVQNQEKINPLVQLPSGSDINHKRLSDLRFIIQDALAGDKKALESPAFKGLGLDNIKLAIEWLLLNGGLNSHAMKTLAQEPWRLVYRAKPPTIQEFLTEDYIGPQAESLFPWIREWLEGYWDPLSGRRVMVLSTAIGLGKSTCSVLSNLYNAACNSLMWHPYKFYGHAEPLDSEIQTPTGPKKMGDLKKGDLVLTPNGQKPILNLFPQGIKKVYKITFSDGRTRRCAEDHLWLTSHLHGISVWDKKNKVYKSQPGHFYWRLKTTEELFQKQSQRYFIPFAKAKYQERKHFIPPYTLGVLLGDGCFSKSMKYANLVSNDKEIIDRVKQECEGYWWDCSKEEKSTKYQISFKKEVTEELKRLGLKGCRSETKFIPEEYLYDSVENRVALLQGLLDTDGHSGDRANVSLSTVSKKLSENFQFLVRSLGGFSKLRVYQTAEELAVKWKRFKSNFPEITATFNSPDKSIEPFFLSRKKEVYHKSLQKWGKTRSGTKYLHITKIEEDGYEECQCLSVDYEENFQPEKFKLQNYKGNLENISHKTEREISSWEEEISFEKENIKGLYLTGDCVVTHNSPSSIYSLVYISGTQKKSSENLLEPMINVLESAPFFERVRTKQSMAEAMREFEDSNQPPNKIYWTTASSTSPLEMVNGTRFKLISSPGALLGQNLIGCTLTELTFLKSDFHWSDEKILRMFKKTLARVDSRMHNNYYGRSIIDSSPNSMEDPIDQWINRDAPKNKRNYVLTGSQWEINKKIFPTIYPNGIDQPPVFTEDNSFTLCIGGNGALPHIIVPGSEQLYIPQQLIKCPMSSSDGISFYDTCNEDPINFVRDQAGLPTEGADRVFYDKQKVENIFCDQLRNHYYFITAPASENPEHLIWDKIKDIFFTKTIDTYRFWYKPEIQRTIAVDQSTSFDFSGIAISHVERDPLHLNPDGSMRTLYVTDFTIAIMPEKRNKINLDAIRYFIIDLVLQGRMNIVAVSFDKYQSDATFQGLQRFGLEVENVSVDRTPDPYITYIDILNRGALKVGRNVVLKNNIFSIQENPQEKKKGRLKYDHTDGEVFCQYPAGYDPRVPNSWKQSWETCLTGTNAKDVLDSQVASIELLRRHNITPYEIWKPEEIIERTYENVKSKTLDFLAKRGLKM